MQKLWKNSQFWGPFLPTTVMKLSFAQLLNAFTQAFMLAHFNLAKPVHLETDTLGFAIAGITSQQ